MSVEVSGSDLPYGNGEAKVEEITPSGHEKENGEVHSENGLVESIKFGSHGLDESAKVEADNASNANFLKDAADEWPAEPQIHSFYLVRYRTYDDPNLKVKIDQADKEIGKRNQQRFQVLEGLKAKRSYRAQVIGQLKSLGAENKQYGQALDEKINQIKPLKEALGSLRGSKNSGRGGMALCSSEEELNEFIRSLNYRMQHEVIPLTEEKQILRDIKQLEGTREKVIVNAAIRAKIQGSLGKKDAIENQVNLIGTDLDEVKKDRQVVRSKIKLLEDEFNAVDSDITSLQQELASITEKRDKAYETIQQLRKQRDEGNACFYQNRTLLNNAKELAAKKNIKPLEELACAEVEQFMSSWSSSKVFRDDYEKRILASLDMRQLSRDGRMRNPNEKPLVLVEQTNPAVGKEDVKPAPKVVKEDVKPPKDPNEQEIVSAQKALKEPKKKQVERATVSEPEAVEEEYFVVEKPKQEKVIDVAKLKEIKRQEEMEKQKQALERKKKLAEKAAAKAAIKAQKEAEKKQKGRERKLKKKESAFAFSSSQDEATENEADVTEAEKADNVEEDTETQISAKTKESKETYAKIRYRGQPKRRDNALPKAILKRKKSNNYWVWAALAATSVAVLLALLFKYAL